MQKIKKYRSKIKKKKCKRLKNTETILKKEMWKEVLKIKKELDKNQSSKLNTESAPFAS